MHAVIWRDAALDQLADVFVRADLQKRDQIEEAVTQLNTALANSPTQIGESRGGRQRVAFAGQCGIYYILDEPISGVVRVTHFWIF